MPAQSNSVTASLFFVAVIIADCLTAVDSTSHQDVPSSLRATSVALVCCFAAPVLTRPKRGVTGVYQRPLIGVALAAAALLGVHHGGSQTRTFDALYTTVVCFVVVWLFAAGGVDEAARRDLVKGQKIDRAISTSSTMLAGSLLLYGNLRIVRAGLRHPTEVRDFRVSPSDSLNGSSTIKTLGYAYASEISTVALTFGGTLGVCSAVLMSRYEHELASGTAAVSLQLGAAATFQVVAAVAASLSLGEQVDWLPAIFGRTACTAATDACEAAAQSRRFALLNTNVPALWLSALGLFCLAYPTQKRFMTAREVGSFVWSGAAWAVGTTATVLALLLVYTFCSFAGEGGHSDYTALAIVASVWISVFDDTLLGSATYAIAFTIEEALFVSTYGVSDIFSHLTHVTLVFCAAILVLNIAMQALTLVYDSANVRLAIGVTSVAGVSLSLGLYVASACLLMSNNGSLGNLQISNGGGSRFAVTFITQHFVPLLVWAPLATCRCEVQLLSTAQRLTSWLVVVPLDLALYAACLLALNVGPPVADVLDARALAGCFFGVGIVPWLSTASI